MAVFDSGNWDYTSMSGAGGYGGTSASSANLQASANTMAYSNDWCQQAEMYERMYHERMNQMQQQMNSNMMYQTWSGSYIPSETESDTFEVPTKDKTRVLSAFEDIKNAAEPVAQVAEDKTSKHAVLLKELGFDKLSDKVKEVAEKAMKTNMISLAGYMRIPADKLAAAKNKIENKNDNSRKLYLLETSVEEYVGQNHDEKNFTLPPTDVLEKLSTAKKAGLFDSFSILHVKAVPDPILLGRVKGEKDAFFIAEWGDDIKVSDIME